MDAYDAAKTAAANFGDAALQKIMDEGREPDDRQHKFLTDAVDALASGAFAKSKALVRHAMKEPGVGIPEPEGHPVKVGSIACGRRSGRPS